MTRSNRVDHNINLLDAPMFVAMKSNDDFYTDKNGHSISVSRGIKLPTRFDKVVLYALMSESQRINSRHIQFNSLRNILDIMHVPCTSKSINRLKESLRKWANTTISFDGDKFYDAETKTRVKYMLIFHVLDVEIAKGTVKIIFDSMFVDSYYAKFTASVYLPAVRKLTDGFSLRLYEVLIKNFEFNNTWSIGLEALFNKIGANYSFRSHCLLRLNKSVADLNNIPGKFSRLTFSIDETDIVSFTIGHS